jgi:3D (Asp-Asp-Asp) domain-containing protein
MKKHINIIIRFMIMVMVVMISKSASITRLTKVQNNNINKTVNLSTMALKIVEEENSKLNNVVDSYTGDLTGYAYNCPLCNGHLACLSGYNVANGTTTFNDTQYGSVKIVASSENLPCGSIVRFNSYKVGKDPVVAIVLDRGVKGNALDLLSPSEDYATSKIGRTSIYYEVLRSGWQSIES